MGKSKKEEDKAALIIQAIVVAATYLVNWLRKNKAPGDP